MRALAPSRPGRSRRLASIALVATLFGMVSACGSDRPDSAPAGSTPPKGPAGSVCVDEDEDGYGVGCSKGDDCDDADPESTFECRCSKPSTGCSCDEVGLIATCGRAHAKFGGQLTCGQGIMTCTDGAWGECILTGDIELPASTLRPLALGGATACANNPCDTGCTTFLDDGNNLTPGTGLQSGSSGITLTGDPNAGSGPPVGGGFGCSGGSYPATTGACSHHICETGAALDAACDNLGAGTTTSTLFSDSFASGNAQGWTLDTSWAIGATSTSSGQTTGNSDPATDTSTGSDNNVAGTVLGGNIGGPTVIFSDTLSNLNNWTQTGDGQWGTQSRSSSWGYSSSGSGSPVAHASNCDNGCTLTLTNAVDLSSYTIAMAPTLTLQRYVDSSLDTGEYLRVEAYNGSTWTVLDSWVSPVNDDSTWYQPSYDLAAYLVSGFKLRFVSMESSSSEHTEVDDVQITTAATLQTRYLVSPAFNASSVNGAVTLQFQRWLNVEELLTRSATIDVYNGITWVNLWTNSTAVSDSAWSTQTFDLTAYKNAAMKLRFGWSSASSSKVSGWNIDDVVVTGSHTSVGTPYCVAAVCAQDPTCCTLGWHAGCLGRVKAACQIDCSKDTATNQCVACYTETTLTTDFDADGFSPAQGDCLECDAGINPGAYDFSGNSVDEDCDGTVDNETSTCDSALAANGDASAHAQAMGLCKVSQNGSWGIVSADFVRADGVTACNDTNQREIAGSFGTGNLPTEGSKVSVFSSGTARASSESGYVQPNGQGYWANMNSTPANAVPAAAGCNTGTTGLDSCGMKLVIKAPTNVNSFAFNFDFFTSEYPEWLCTAYNDSFVAYYSGSLNTQADKNISFDSLGNPVSVNNGLFTIPGGSPPQATGAHEKLDGTGFDGVCGNNYTGSTYTPDSVCGGATGWLNTTAPVKPGEQVSLHFSIWDTGDRRWDSTVLLDNFRWSASTATITTGVYTPGSSAGTPLAAASFVRDYDMSSTCGKSQKPRWSLWSWSASTPADSRVEFYVSTAASAADLATAAEDQLQFSDPPGPSALAGQHAIAQASSSTQTGSASVLATLDAEGRVLGQPFLRVRSYLVPSSDNTKAPTLSSWNLQASCVDSE